MGASLLRETLEQNMSMSFKSETVSICVFMIRTEHHVHMESLLIFFWKCKNLIPNPMQEQLHFNKHRVTQKCKTVWDATRNKGYLAENCRPQSFQMVTFFWIRMIVHIWQNVLVKPLLMCIYVLLGHSKETTAATLCTIGMWKTKNTFPKSSYGFICRAHYPRLYFHFPFP